MFSLKNKRILITSGPVWVPIDDVRVISNRSSGQLGQILAWQLIQQGASVHLLEGPIGFNDFLKSIKEKLKKPHDAIFHLAAVSDYQLEKPFKRKLSSRLKSLKLELIPTPKIINFIKKINPKIFLIGFKLEPTFNKKTVYQKCLRLFKDAQCDLVVANSAQDKKYQAYILDKQNILTKASSREELAKKLIQITAKKI